MAGPSGISVFGVYSVAWGARRRMFVIGGMDSMGEGVRSRFNQVHVSAVLWLGWRGIVAIGICLAAWGARRCRHGRDLDGQLGVHGWGG